MDFKKIQNRNICILGWGIENQALVKFLLKKKVDDMVTSRAPVNTQDPFVNNPASENMSDDKIDAIEEKSARAFWGDVQYEEMLRDNK